jgi:hypothetical protein
MKNAGPSQCNMKAIASTRAYDARSPIAASTDRVGSSKNSRSNLQ